MECVSPEIRRKFGGVKPPESFAIYPARNAGKITRRIIRHQSSMKASGVARSFDQTALRIARMAMRFVLVIRRLDVAPASDEDRSRNFARRKESANANCLFLFSESRAIHLL